MTCFLSLKVQAERQKCQLLSVTYLERVEQEECERAERETADLLAHFAPRPAAMAAD